MKRVSTKRLASLFGALLLVVGIAVGAMPPGIVHAVPITVRSLTLEANQDLAFCSGLTIANNNTKTDGLCDSNGDGLADGGSMPSSAIPAYVSDSFTFTAPSQADTVTLTYCTTAASVVGGTQCDTPGGLDATNATLGNDGGLSGWTISNKTLNSITLTGTAQAATVANLRLDDIANPTAVNTTFFVRIATTLSGAAKDSGTVAASTTNAIQLKGTMPESLVFCTGATIGLNSGNVPDCTSATPGDIQFNQLFDPTSTAFATSQMAASTNAGQGYAITVGGPTLTSGSNTIDAMTTTAQSKFGVSQFGLNLVLNDGPDLTDPNNPLPYANSPNITGMPAGYADSANIAPASVDPGAGSYHGVADTGFNTEGSFTFNDGGLNTVATSGFDDTKTDNLGTAIGTDSQIYTVSYIVNVPGSQPAGTYTTTLTYICTATY